MTDAPPADMMQRRCPACNSPILPDAKFCESCGAKIEPIRLCVNCGAPLPPDAKFCETCGKPVGKPLSGEKPTKPVTTPIPAAPEPVKPCYPFTRTRCCYPRQTGNSCAKGCPQKTRFRGTGGFTGIYSPATSASHKEEYNYCRCDSCRGCSYISHLFCRPAHDVQPCGR